MIVRCPTISMSKKKRQLQKELRPHQIEKQDCQGYHNNSWIIL